MAIDFNLLGPSARGRYSRPINEHDVAMSIRKCGREESRALSFVFYNNSYRKFLYKSTHIQIGVDQKALRIYFKPSDNQRDVRMAFYHTSKPDETRREAQKSIPIDLAKVFEPFSGLYDLQYDKDAGLYYIDLNFKY